MGNRRRGRREPKRIGGPRRTLDGASLRSGSGAAPSGLLLPRPGGASKIAREERHPLDACRFPSSSHCAKRSSSSGRRRWRGGSGTPHELAEATRAAADLLGLELFPERKHASDTVTAIKNPSGMDDAQVRKVLQQTYNYSCKGGQGALTGQDLPDRSHGDCQLARPVGHRCRPRADSGSSRSIRPHPGPRSPPSPSGCPEPGTRRSNIDDHSRCAVGPGRTIARARSLAFTSTRGV